MDRIQQGLASTIAVTLYRDGTAENPSPDSATVRIVRADGTELVADTAAIDDGTGVFAYTLSPTQTALLDTLTAHWTVTFDGVAQTLQTAVEVVGGFIVSLHDLATVLTGKTQAELAEKRVRIEQRLEKELGYACVPRYTLEPRRARDGIVATRMPLRALRSLSTTVGGVTTAYTSQQLTALRLETWAVWGVWARGPVVIGYEHGRDYPDSDITEAALLLAEEAYGTNTVDGRVISQSADNMAVTYAAASSGPFVNARLNQIVQTNRLPGIA